MATLRFAPFLSLSPPLFPVGVALRSSGQTFHFTKSHAHLCYYKRITSRFVSFAVAESDSPKSVEEEEEEPVLPLLKELADCLILPPDFLSSLPSDLLLDLNDAAFDLSNGPVLDECGEEIGEMLLNISRAWERADTSTSNSIAQKLPSIESSLKGNVKPALGKRLVSAGRRFQSMGQFGQGELQKIAKSMIKVGKTLSKTRVVETDKDSEKKSRMLKFGQMEFELTQEKAYIGAAVGFLFGVLSWTLTQGVQNVPESSLQYANDNALTLAKSLRGALLAMCYSSTILSAFTSVGLLLLANRLSSENKSE
ncbi:hypothetical protein LUZ60_006841 [Juncus effusus]|nr:hypothetical protein LUZ60_006841 [Juncus effusus]